MAITLPRYSSTALPQESTLSPPAAAAREMAPAQFGVAAAGQVSQFAKSLYEAEQQAKVDYAVAQTKMESKSFLAEADWKQDRADDDVDFQGRVIKKGKPTEQAKIEQWGKVKERVGGLTEEISGKYKASAESQISEILFDAELEAQDKVNTILIQRGKNMTYDTVSVLQASGDFGGAREAIINGSDNGFLPAGERNAMLEKNLQRAAMNPYVDALTSGNGLFIDAAASSIQDNDSIPPEKRASVYKQLIAESKRLEADFQNNPAFEDNYVQFLPGVINGTVGLNQVIENRKNLSDKRFDKLVGISMARTESKEGGDITSSAGQSVIDNVTRDVMTYALRDQTMPYDDQVERAKNLILADPRISTVDAGNAVKKLDALLKVQRDNPMYRKLLDVERAAITGMSGTGIFTVTADSQEEALIYETMELAFYEAAEAAGPTFSPKAWLDENRFSYRLPAIQKVAEKGKWGLVISADGKDLDFELTQKNIENRANEKLALDEDDREGFMGSTPEERKLSAETWYGREISKLNRILGNR